MADVLALHGFTQRGSMWQEVARLAGGVWEAPDLPGHGAEPVVEWEQAIAGIGEVLEASGGAAVLVGYSMGGRLALAAALAGYPMRGLVLISASPGIDDPGARRRRGEEDGLLADRLERLGVEVFVDEWLSQDLFSGLGRRPTAWGRADRRMRISNSACGLAGALRELGQGSQPYLGDRLGELPVPLLAVAGALDERYARLANWMAGCAPSGRSRVIPAVGHPVAAEAPGPVADAMRSVLAG